MAPWDRLSSSPPRPKRPYCPLCFRPYCCLCFRLCFSLCFPPYCSLSLCLLCFSPRKDLRLVGSPCCVTCNNHSFISRQIWPACLLLTLLCMETGPLSSNPPCSPKLLFPSHFLPLLHGQLPAAQKSPEDPQEGHLVVIIRVLTKIAKKFKPPCCSPGRPGAGTRSTGTTVTWPSTITLLQIYYHLIDDFGSEDMKGNSILVLFFVFSSFCKILPSFVTSVTLDSVISG